MSADLASVLIGGGGALLAIIGLMLLRVSSDAPEPGRGTERSGPDG